MLQTKKPGDVSSSRALHFRLLFLSLFLGSCCHGDVHTCRHGDVDPRCHGDIELSSCGDFLLCHHGDGNVCVVIVTLTCVAMVTLTCVAMVTSLQTCEEKLGKLNPDNNQMIVLSMYETYSGCKVIQL